MLKFNTIARRVKTQKRKFHIQIGSNWAPCIAKLKAFGLEINDRPRLGIMLLKQLFFVLQDENMMSPALKHNFILYYYLLCTKTTARSG